MIDQMDPLSTTSGIIAIIQLSSEVVQYISVATGATKQRRLLRNELQACDDILQLLVEEADDAEDGRAWSETINALQAPGAPLGRLCVMLNLIKAKLQPREGLKQAIMVLRWPFEEKEVGQIISAIEREKSLLQLALANEHRKLIQDIKKCSGEHQKQLTELITAVNQSSRDHQIRLGVVEDGISRVNTRQETDDTRKEKQAILDWLTPVDYTSQHNDHFRRRQAGTGQWFLESQEYQTWVETKGQTLFCPGIPGAGKTILAATVIDDLYSRSYANAATVGIYYIYCDYRRREEQNSEDLLASLLRQLAQSHPSLPESLKALYDRHKARRTRPSLEDISRVMQTIADESSRMLIVIDALDECHASDSYRLIHEIRNLQNRNGAGLLVTSRSLPEIIEEFNAFPSKAIRANSDDVKRYLDGHDLRLPKFVALDISLQQEIKTGIVEAVGGMFLLAKLYLDSIVGKRSPKAIRLALKTLKGGGSAYNSAYENAMTRIQNQSQDQGELAKQVLLWLTCAKRPLTKAELQTALAVEIDEPALDASNLPQIEDIISVCAGLVTVDEESGIVRLVHHTAQDYFERTQQRWFPEAYAVVTRTCITYLSFEEFESGVTQTMWEFEKRLKLHPFYDYAANNWGHHAHVSKSWSDVLSFLYKKAPAEAASQGLLTARRVHRIEIQQATGLHLAAYFGLEEVAEAIMNTTYDSDVVDTCDETPLLYAAENGYASIVRLLLDAGAAIDAKDGYHGMTALCRAAQNGHSSVVKLLLDEGAAVDIRCSLDVTPLMFAAKKGHRAVVNLLIDRNANVDAKDEYYRTPLSYASANGHEPAVKLLLDTGAAIDAEAKCHCTPLSYASENGNEAVVRLLLDRGAAIDAHTHVGRTPLALAVERGHDAVIKLLLDTGANSEAKDDYGLTPLLLAASHSHLGAIPVLLNKGVNIEATDSYGQTPLSLAASEGSEVALLLFLAKGADIEAKDNTGRSALFYAARKGNEALFKLLLVNHGHLNIMELLLATDIDIDSEDVFGRTPLWWAEKMAYIHMAKLLL
ncbi:ankyrin repeat-containing domain protein [Xylariales sp. AK1849]|nr:ankyrin repeat-containing domain protein [Xylariales sp. AK1849]